MSIIGTVSGVPQSWIDAIGMLHGAAIPSLIAGGAVRDWRLERPIKDVDMWVPARNLGEFEDILVRVRKVFGTPIEAFTASVDEYRVWNWECLGFETYEVGPLTIQVIGTDLQSLGPEDLPPRQFCPESVTGVFDFGICQAAFDGYSLYFSEAFEKDAKDEAFTLLRGGHPDQVERSIARFVRIGAKYPGWKFRLAPNLSITDSGTPSIFASSLSA